LEEVNGRLATKPLSEKLDFLLSNCWKNLVVKVDLSNKNSFQFVQES
jgi:hypothetical protein